MEKSKVIFLFFLGTVLLGAIYIPGYLRIRNLSRQNRDLEQQIKEIQQANRKLEQERHQLINDPLYLEQVAREKLGVAREGEIIYRVLTPEESQ